MSDKQYRPFFQLAAQVDKLTELVNVGYLDPAAVYDTVFSTLGPHRAYELGFDIEYCDPDSGYVDDVQAWNGALQEEVRRVRPVAVELGLVIADASVADAIKTSLMPAVQIMVEQMREDGRVAPSSAVTTDAILHELAHQILDD